MDLRLCQCTRQILTGPALEAFLMRKRGATWDNLPLPAFSMADVDDGVVSKFKSLAAKKGRMETNLLDEPKEVLLDKLHLKNGDYLTNAAMLLFNSDPERYQTGAYIKIGYFENDAELLYQDEIHGSILEQVDKALDVIYLKYMRAKIRESWGRGGEKICHALKADNLPLPEYIIHPGDIMIKFTAPEDRVVRLNKQFTDNLSDNLSDNLPDKERKTPSQKLCNDLL